MTLVRSLLVKLRRRGYSTAARLVFTLRLDPLRGGFPPSRTKYRFAAQILVFCPRSGPSSFAGGFSTLLRIHAAKRPERSVAFPPSRGKSGGFHPPGFCPLLRSRLPRCPLLRAIVYSRCAPSATAPRFFGASAKPPFRLCGERRSSVVSKLCRLRPSERYEACDVFSGSPQSRPSGFVGKGGAA